jgi:hypothetical protein
LKHLPQVAQPVAVLAAVLVAVLAAVLAAVLVEVLAAVLVEDLGFSQERLQGLGIFLTR